MARISEDVMQRRAALGASGQSDQRIRLMPLVMLTSSVAKSDIATSYRFGLNQLPPGEAAGG
jgi:hypothetical protein